MALDPVDVGNWRPFDTVRIKPGHGVRPVRLLTGSKGNVTPDANKLLGSTALAGLGLIGGTRLHVLIATNTGALNSIRRIFAEPVPFKAAPGALAFTTNTITRATGSWIDDGWAVDDMVVVEGATTLANNVAAVITGITATTLTFANGTFSTAEAFAAGTTLWNGTFGPVSSLPANAGNAVGINPVDLLSDAMPSVDPAPNRHLFVGSSSAVFFALLAAAGANTYVDLTGIGGDF